MWCVVKNEEVMARVGPQRPPPPLKVNSALAVCYTLAEYHSARRHALSATLALPLSPGNHVHYVEIKRVSSS